MRKLLILSALFLALSLGATTPELGKDKLRKLIKLPTISFPPSWTFDPERGFILGSTDLEASNKIAALRLELKHDNSDAERFLQLGRLSASINRGTEARTSFTGAVALFRKRVDSQPDDASLLTSFGEALQGAGKNPEAESVLRKAVRLAPKDSSCWIALGRLLDAEAHGALLGTPTDADVGNASDKLSPALVSQAQKCLNEAAYAFDQAVTNAPRDSQVYFRRAIHRSLRNTMLNQIRLASGERKEDVDLLTDYFSTEGLADLQHASKLDSNNFRLIGNAILYEIYATCAHKGQVNWHDFSWNSLPDKSQRSIRDALTRLENLSDNPDVKIAAGALEILAVLHGPVFRESSKSLADLHRAVALDPSREHAWELMASTVAQSGHYDDLLTLSEDRLRRNDTTRNRIILAKAYEKLKRWDDAEEEIQFAIKDSPDDFVLNLGLGALLLKRSQGDPATLAEADGWLAHAQEILKKYRRRSAPTSRSSTSPSPAASISPSLTKSKPPACGSNPCWTRTRTIKWPRKFFLAMDY